jgi:hypothetical protein
MRPNRIFAFCLLVIQNAWAAPLLSAVADGQVAGETKCQWEAQYFTNIDLDGIPFLTRCESGPPNYSWKGTSPGPGIPGAFSARWTGIVTFAAGPTTFTSIASDGVVVWVDDRIVINDWIWQPITTDHGVAFLSSGAHKVIVEYFIEDPGDHGSMLKLSWKAGAKRFARYCNERFGSCVTYPSDLTPDPLPMNGDGRKFHDAKGFVMTVGGFNSLDRSISTEIKLDEEQFDDITYRAMGKNWFVLSGHKGLKVLYIKAFVGKGSTSLLWLEYPTSLKSRYDHIVKEISGSFRSGDIHNPG